ncbi:MAG: sulfoxide reductase heme-binding subunit YedZ [Gammaproteobacteria bacterium HGW-Gammaproteobacteria-3]|nr:MAG: sulfoxide reductase heme-binding subunit YedZ [Gammaproteobacteria bacterium HGW-Gammaproteobacteria-3]
MRGRVSGYRTKQGQALCSLKLPLFLIALTPFAVMVWKTVHHDLGANPVESLSRMSGLWALRLLLITLALTPYRMLFKQPGVIKYRRMLGLFTFFYASLHLAIYVVLEKSLTWDYILEDIGTVRIPIGLLAYVLLIPLALTSSNSMMRKLGAAWKKLHTSVYVIAFLSLLHFLLSEKADFREPLFYGIILIALLLVRGVVRNRK